MRSYRCCAPGPQSSRPRKIRGGFSLIEVMLAMAVFSVFAAGITSAVLYLRRTAEVNVYGTTAHAVAQGYLEQIKNLTFDQVDVARTSADSDNPTPLDTVSVSALMAGEFDEIDDQLLVGQMNAKEVLVDIKNPGEDDELQLIMDMEITPTITTLNTGTEPLPALEILIDYRFLAPGVSGKKWHSGSVRSIKVQN